MLRLVPDHIKINKLCKHAVKKLPFLIKYAPDRYKTQRMCDEVILQNGGIFFNDYVAFGDLDSDFVTFFSRDIGLIV